MAHTRILRYGRKQFLTQAQIAANNPKNPEKADIPPNLRNSDYKRDRENQWRNSGEACTFPDATIRIGLDEGG